MLKRSSDDTILITTGVSDWTKRTNRFSVQRRFLTSSTLIRQSSIRVGFKGSCHPRYRCVRIENRKGKNLGIDLAGIVLFSNLAQSNDSAIYGIELKLIKYFFKYLPVEFMINFEIIVRL